MRKVVIVGMLASLGCLASGCSSSKDDDNDKNDGKSCPSGQTTVCEAGTLYSADGCGQREGVIKACACGCDDLALDCASCEACTPTDCESAGAQCGSIPDGCGSEVECGECALPQTCGGGGVPNACGEGSCVPATCESVGANCGALSDGCAAVLQCGVCSAPETCGGGGVENVCGAPACAPATCATLSAGCGNLPDGCGGTIDCGACSAPETCGGGGVPNVCGEGTCAPSTCAAQNAECGPMPDGCGAVLDCGTCVAPTTCGGAGVANQCGCTPSTCAAQGAECGIIDNGCGGSLDCGGCTAPEVCGAANLCEVPAGTFLPVAHPAQNTDLTAVWGNGWSEVWVVGKGGTAIRASGGAWESFPVGTSDLVDVWGNTNGFFAVTKKGTCLKFGGSAWESIGGMMTGSKVWGSASNRVFFAGTNLTSSGHVGTMLKWNGWEMKDVALYQAPSDFSALGGVGMHTWVGYWSLHKDYSDGGFNPQTMNTNLGFVRDIWAFDGDTAYAVGDLGMAKYDGWAWGAVNVPTAQSLYGVWGLSEDSLWAVGGNGTILHWDGSQWNDIPNPAHGTGTTLREIWGTSDHDLWVVGDEGTVLYRD